MPTRTRTFSTVKSDPYKKKLRRPQSNLWSEEFWNRLLELVYQENPLWIPVKRPKPPESHWLAVAVYVGGKQRHQVDLSEHVIEEIGDMNERMYGNR